MLWQLLNPSVLPSLCIHCSEERESLVPISPCCWQACNIFLPWAVVAGFYTAGLIASHYMRNKHFHIDWMNHYWLMSTVLPVWLVYIYKRRLNWSERSIQSEQLIHADRIQNPRFDSRSLAHVSFEGLTIWHHVIRLSEQLEAMMTQYLLFPLACYMCSSSEIWSLSLRSGLEGFPTK